MAGGLVALLDDVAALARLAAASLDDIGAAATRAGVKAAGVVIDDAAVTPRYVTGLSPARELPIIGRIALGSLRNKLLFLLPAALLLNAFAPWAITPILMAGGAYLCFEATEKVIEALTGHDHKADAEVVDLTPEQLEGRQVAGAIRTDLILSAEIMAIALAEVASDSFWTTAAALAAVAVAITVAVYGAVALIVKMDDAGLALARRPGTLLPALGRGLVRGMPYVMKLLSIVGIAAMIWVGGGIIVHGLHDFHLDGIPALVKGASDWAAHVVAFAPGSAAWLATAALSALVGFAVGGAIAGVLHLVRRRPH